MIRPQPHTPDHLGETCPECDTHHRVIESIPDKPLSDEELDELRDSSGVEFCRGVMVSSGGLVGRPDAREATESIVLSTKSTTQLLARYEGVGWVVEQEVYHDKEVEPENVGIDAWMEATQHAAEVFQEVMGGCDP